MDEARKRVAGESMERLIEILKNRNQGLAMRSAALERLVTIEESGALQAVNEIILGEDAHTELRVAAVESVGAQHRGGAIDALVAVLNKGSKRIRCRAAAALGEMEAWQSIEPLIAVLDDYNQHLDVKCAAISALGRLGKLGDTRISETLLRVMHDPTAEDKTRYTAAWSLAEPGLADKRVIEVLRRTAISANTSHLLRAQAASSLARLAARAPTHDSYVLSRSVHRSELDDAMDRFRRYDEYLESIRDRLPPGARAYAFGPSHNSGTREAPHDSWLEMLEMRVRSSGARSERRELDIHAHLLGSDHDGYIEFHYTNVHEADLAVVSEWLYDEVRLGEEGRVIHEIRFDSDSRWLIECEDFTYEWKPFTLSST
ncbi:MAG: HEAT repeat domain-containing protein [Chloroflexia bacterium]